MAIEDLTWKGRLIINMNGHVDLPPDRQEIVGPDPVGPRDVETRMKFIELLNDAMPQQVLFGIIKDKLRTGEIHTRERNEVVLFDENHEGTHWLITGNSNASHGYFYVEARIVANPTYGADGSREAALTVPAIGTRVELSTWLAEIGQDPMALSLVTDALDEMVHEVKSREASDINNGGVDAQVDFLLRGRDDYVAGLLRDLRDALKD